MFIMDIEDLLMYPRLLCGKESSHLSFWSVGITALFNMLPEQTETWLGGT